MKVTDVIKEFWSWDIDDPIDTFVANLIKIKNKALEDGYKNIKLQLETWDEYGEARATLRIIGDREETEGEKAEKLNKEKQYKESRKRQYEELKKEFENE